MSEKQYKFCVTFIQNDNITTNKDYYKLTDIMKDYPTLSYHQIRQIYLQSTGKKVNRLQETNRQLFDRMKITDKKINI